MYQIEMKSDSKFDVSVELKKILECNNIVTSSGKQIFNLFEQKCRENDVIVHRRTIFIETLEAAKIHCLAYEYNDEQALFFTLGAMSTFSLIIK